MKGDFTRLGLDSTQHFSRVFHQQGRVSLDSDANESAAVVLHHLRTLSRDLFGAFGGPVDGNGFALAMDTTQQPALLTIGAGHYYVDGILCEADTDCDYGSQPDYTPELPDAAGNGGDPLLRWLDTPNPDQRFWLYLDVWERHITWIEDDRIRESALGGPDTCTRAKVIWQVKALLWDPVWDQAGRSPCETPMDSLSGLGAAQMAARVDPGQQIDDPCVISPEARFRGAENQLYRVEIHRGGDVSSATFKWSRDNGSVATRWLASEGDVLVVSHSRGFEAGDWVELSHDALDLAGLPGELVRLAKVEGDRLTMEAGGATMAWTAQLSNPKVRRWNQRGNDDTLLVDGAVGIVEMSATDPAWIDLEDGVQIQFAPGGHYRSGDYWTIRASVATGDIEWPPYGAPDASEMQAPQGIEHHYAPLGVVLSNNNELQIEPCRRCVEIPAVACRAPVAKPAATPKPRTIGPRVVVERGPAPAADKPARRPRPK